MPASAPYIPSKQANLNNWLNNFATLITANPSFYGLMASDATTIQNAVNAWNSAYAMVTSPTTKTPSSVSAKDTARVTVLGIVRPYAQQVSNNPGVTSANKIALGLNPKTSTPSPVTPPASNPILSILSQGPGIVNFTYRDALTSPSSKAKPYGVKQCQIYGLQSATVITDPTKLSLQTLSTKSPFQFSFPAGYTPGSVWYFASRWMTQKGQTGPWSPIITLVAT